MKTNLLLVLGLVLGMSALAGSQADRGPPSDVLTVRNVYTGKAEVRRYWAEVSGPFRPEHHWIGYTPAMRMHAEVDGGKASLYFECLWMEVDTNAVGAHSFSDMKLARIQGHWLVKDIRVGKIEKL